MTFWGKTSLNPFTSSLPLIFRPSERKKIAFKSSDNKFSDINHLSLDMNDETKKDFLEEAEKEKKTLEESYQESKRQTEERKSKEWTKGYDKWKKNK